MTRGNLGVAGEIELAEMAALPPLAQVIADMDGLDTVGSRRGRGCVHGGKTYHANFARSITSDVIELAIQPGHLRDHRR
jgi:hypothetical protein